MLHYLWGEAAATATYFINRSLAKKLQDKTPEEAWCGVKKSVQHLKLFGSLCFEMSDLGNSYTSWALSLK
ncbi:putative RNA-directed DNA polymerase [Medicago truncatula]|uniref:Putative RNA-directed DNA polymerase n=1 Tax=Medicago truncatula TaxID=3880 RepID=I3S0Z3_MEDTR|nr:unknown [Medicago truncatula]RHN66183.1 putative RNA-directed DNA polymerase [Medicago truncatula]